MTDSEPTLVYGEGGETFYGEVKTDETVRDGYKYLARKSGYTGYLSGRQNKTNKRVIVFFREKPSEKEILRRRKNGFLYARWYWIKEK